MPAHPIEEVVRFQGSLRLNGTQEFAPIIALLNAVVEGGPTQIILNLQELKFLNSSGINVLSRFVLKVREQASLPLVIQGSKQIPWQGKSLKNLQRLMPSSIVMRGMRFLSDCIAHSHFLS